MYEIYTKEYLSIQKKTLSYSRTSVVRRKTTSCEQENASVFEVKRLSVLVKMPKRFFNSRRRKIFLRSHIQSLFYFYPKKKIRERKYEV